jgi:hypothetical protein
MPAQWSRTSETSHLQGVKMVCYADAGAGKTLLCATAPKPIILSAEAGLLSLSQRNIERVYGVGVPGISYDIPVLQVTTIQQLDEAYNLFANPANRMAENCGTICLDSITEIAEQVLANAKVNSKDGRQQYGELADRTIVTLKKFRDLQPYHVYMSAKMAFEKDEGSGLSRFTVSMPGKQLGPQVPYLVDEIFHLGIGKTPQGVKYRYLRTDQDLQYVAKDRSGALDEIEKPDLSNIIRKIQGALA